MATPPRARGRGRERPRPDLAEYGADEVPAPADQQMVWDKNYEDIQMASPEEVDVVFMTNMIPHHAAAIPMAQLEITQGADAEAIQLAEMIKMAQREEIMTMVASLRERN